MRQLQSHTMLIDSRPWPHGLCVEQTTQTAEPEAAAVTTAALEAEIFVEKVLRQAEVTIEAEALARVHQQALHGCNKIIVSLQSCEFRY